MPKTRMSPREKLEKEQGRKVVDDPKGRGRMLIPKPLDIDGVVRRVEKGRLITDSQIRECLAKSFQADITCPLCTGIFLRMVAEAAEEDLGRGINEVAPYWRVLKADGSLNEKFPGGAEAQAARLIKEGHAIEAGRGKKPPKVKDFNLNLQEL